MNSNEPYVRSEAEIAHQRAYEVRESARQTSAVQITYRIHEVPSVQERAGSRFGIAWYVTRQVGDGKEEKSVFFFRRIEVTDHLRESMWRDKLAAERLGISIFTFTKSRA